MPSGAAGGDGIATKRRRAARNGVATPSTAGGGRGLRPAHSPAELATAAGQAAAEARAAFGDPRIYLERFVPAARHVEVQLLGDGERVIHASDRDCSVQRRYQKVAEEAPAPALAEGLRAEIHDAAVAFGSRLGYRGLGTVAFLADASAGDTIRTMAREYAAESGREAYVFEGTSPGAARIGAIRLDPS